MNKISNRKIYKLFTSSLFLVAVVISMSVFASCGKKGCCKKACSKKAWKENMEQMFQEADMNKDGKISKEEHDMMHSKKFSKADANKDGFVTMDEMKDAHANMMKGMKKMEMKMDMQAKDNMK